MYDMKRLALVPLFGLMLGLCFGFACGATTKGLGKTAIAEAVDCTTPDRLKLEAQFGPTVEQAIQRATGMDGKIDVPSLQQIGDHLEADGWCVVETSAAKLIAWLATKIPNAPAAAAAPLDGPDLAAQIARLRVQKFGATQFQLAAGP